MGDVGEIEGSVFFRFEHKWEKNEYWGRRFVDGVSFQTHMQETQYSVENYVLFLQKLIAYLDKS